MKDPKKSIIKALITISVIGFIVFVYFSKSQIFSIFFLCLYIFSSLYSLIDKLRHRFGKANAIYFPTVNDEYTQSTSTILGSIIILLTLILLLSLQESNFYVCAGFIFGLSTLLNGLFDLPNGRITLNKKMIKLFGIDENIPQSDIKIVEIFNNRIVLSKTNEEKLTANNLLIDFKYATKIETYINDRKINKELLVVNNFHQA